jgi:hypothetical protein
MPNESFSWDVIEELILLKLQEWVVMYQPLDENEQALLNKIEKYIKESSTFSFAELSLDIR